MNTKNLADVLQEKPSSMEHLGSVLSRVLIAIPGMSDYLAHHPESLKIDAPEPAYAGDKTYVLDSWQLDMFEQQLDLFEKRNHFYN